MTNYNEKAKLLPAAISIIQPLHTSWDVAKRAPSDQWLYSSRDLLSPRPVYNQENSAFVNHVSCSVSALRAGLLPR